MSRFKRITGYTLLTLMLAVGIQVYLYRHYMIIAPGIAKDLGSMVTVEGGYKDAKGAFLLTAVSTQRANIFSSLLALIAPQVDMVPLEQEIPKGADMDIYLRIMQKMMEESQMIAKAVALKEVGHIPRVIANVRIEEVLPGSPARGKLKAGDSIISIDGHVVRTAQETVDAIQEHRIGDEVTVRVRRGDRILNTMVTTIRHRDQAGKAAIGVLIAPYIKYQLPVAVRISARDIKGSSAGMMFALEILNQLVKEDLTHGYIIAGTGTLNIDGRVGPVAGIKQKVVAAEREGANVFLVPVENAAEAKKAARKIRVVQVRSFGDAREHLAGLSGRKSRASGE